MSHPLCGLLLYIDVQDAAVVRKLSERMPDIGRKVEYLLNTGNLVSKSGLDLSQVSGFTVVAEKLNFFRYISHFRWVWSSRSSQCG